MDLLVCFAYMIDWNDYFINCGFGELHGIFYNTFSVFSN